MKLIVGLLLGYGLGYLHFDRLPEIDQKHPCLDFMLQAKPGLYYLKQNFCLELPK